MSDDVLRVSISKIRLARRCMKAFDYKYNQKLSRKRKAVPLLKGSILHDFLNARAKGASIGEVTSKYNEQYRRLFQEERELYGTIVDDMLRVYEAYCRHYDEETWKYLASEHEVEYEIADGIVFVGYIDKVIIDKQDRRFSVDHKTSRSLPNEETQFSDLQQLMYVYVYNKLNPKKLLDGVIWDYLRSKPPTIPEVLKNGSLSKRQIDTDYWTYVKAIRQAGLKTSDYTDILESLRVQQSPFFKRVVLPSPPESMISSVLDDIIATAKMIRGLRHVYQVRNLSRDCAQCEFYNLCQAELRGHDAAFIRKNDYITRQETDNGSEENEDSDSTE